MPQGGGDPLEALFVALRRMTPMPPDEKLNPTILRTYTDLVNRIARLPGRDARAIAPLLESLGPGEGRGVFERVLEHVETFPPEVAGPALIEALQCGGLGPRKWAALGLGRIAYAPAVPSLRRALEDDDLSVRKNADLALRRIAATTAAEKEAEDEGHDPMFDGIAQE